ncbi:hypothetical protein HPP92_013373 [Vanilla planifolia]|uniref:ABC transporter domain-containing protein n=1 Tax=Vanilla planifolia TaxID=51239 RepID=A0A835QZA0_VANPL|nr:hypothetical protein HPP92_013373 [Vanilla planifolia]
MDITVGIRRVDLQSSFLRPRLSSFSLITLQPRRTHVALLKKAGFGGGIKARFSNGVTAVVVETAEMEADAVVENIESLLSDSSSHGESRKPKRKKSSGGASYVSSGIKLESISKSFHGVTLLKDVSWEVKKGEKVGLVGVNGAGKTTQLRIIAGQEEPDGGNLVKAKENMKIALLNQEFEVCPSRTVKEEFLSAFIEEMEIAERLEKVQKALESSVEDLSLMGKLLDELDLLQRRAQDVNLDDVDKIMIVWHPDLLLLDEPTNHLDLDTIEWLEGYLQKQDVPIVVISHDRAFLDQLCTKIVETDMGISKTFLGNYSEYVMAKATWSEAQYAAWEKQQKEIEHTKELINRLGGGANSGRASSEEKKLEKLQEDGLVEKPFQRKQLKIRFPERGRSGKTILTIQNLDFGFGDEKLFDKANLIFERGEKVAIIGPNGCGKSTLLKLIMGLEQPNGSVTKRHNVLPNYRAEPGNHLDLLLNNMNVQAEAFDLNKTVLQTVEEVAEDWRIDDIKGLLGRCNFKTDMLDRKVSLLSGGEKARLAFCKFMVKPSTLLILDEPTNHLDIPSKEMLEEAISEFQGTVITVSHDRYFIKQIVNRVVEVKDKKLQDYGGDYNYYLEKNLEARDKELEREAELEAKAPKVKAKSKMSKEEKEVRKKQKVIAFQQAKAKSKGSKNLKRWK